jgi:hypothetical protein
VGCKVVLLRGFGKRTPLHNGGIMATDSRAPIHSCALPTTAFLLDNIPFFFSARRRIAIRIFPLILDLCLRSPGCTFGNPSADHCSSLFFHHDSSLVPQICHGVSTRVWPDAPAYIGDPSCGGTGSGETLDITILAENALGVLACGSVAAWY